jgi:hypothetical protein
VFERILRERKVEPIQPLPVLLNDLNFVCEAASRTYNHSMRWSKGAEARRNAASLQELTLSVFDQVQLIEDTIEEVFPLDSPD